jgi:hypothetical protein
MKHMCVEEKVYKNNVCFEEVWRENIKEYEKKALYKSQDLWIRYLSQKQETRGW